MASLQTVVAEHYFSKRPLAKLKEEHFSTQLRGSHLKFLTASGMFSVKEIDFGTRLLAECASVHAGEKVLDLGCGYGSVGISIKKSIPGAQVYMSDINKRAILYAVKNCKLNKASCKVFNSNLFSHPELQGLKFDVVLTNPPFSAGRAVCAAFIKESCEHLSTSGSLYLVAPHNKGGSSLKKIMLETFGNANDICKRAGFRVYLSKKN